MSKNDTYAKLNVGSLLKAPGFGGGSAVTISDPITRTRIAVTLDQLKPFDLNPRHSRNPRHDDIKESIRTRGLDSPPPVSRRPSDAHYVIVNGGNTRLQILNELWEETQDRRFYEVECDFVPWVSDAHALAGHLIENDARGDMTFIDRALAIRKLQSLWEAREGVDLSLRDMVRLLAEAGYRISHGHLGKFEFALNHLYPHIPQTLHGGLGRPQIEKLARLRTACQKAWRTHVNADSGCDDDEFSIAFGLALASCDLYHDAWDYEVVEDDVLRQLAGTFAIQYSQLQLAVEQALYERGSNNEDDELVVSRSLPTGKVDSIPVTEGAPPSPAPVAAGSGASAPGTSPTAKASRESSMSTPVEPVALAAIGDVGEATPMSLPPDLKALVTHSASITRQSMQLWAALSRDNPDLFIEQLWDSANSIAQLGGLPSGYLAQDANRGFELLAPAPEIGRQWSDRERAVWWLLAETSRPEITVAQRAELVNQVPYANPLWALLHDFSSEMPTVDPTIMVATVFDLMLSSRHLLHERTQMHL